MTANEIKDRFTYKQLQSYNSSIRSKYNDLKFQYNILVKKQEDIIKKEVKIQTNIYEKKLKDKDKIIEEKDKEIEALKYKLAHMFSALDNDSTNSGIPTSKTPLNKKKYIPNSREKTEKKLGGQEGHKKHKLQAFNKEEANEVITVIPKLCPYCGSNDILELDSSIDKCETDYEVKVIKRIYEFKDCTCNKCNKTFREKIPEDLKEENQYGKTLQSLAVCLTNEIYTPFNKTVKLISGITNGEINMSEGYVAKLQKRASKYTSNFIKELKEYFPKQEVFGWDDGVIQIGKKQGILRVYCTDKVALLIGHEHKDKGSIKEDDILTKCSNKVIVMHDHVLHNYNEIYNHDNVECVIHLIRRLNKMKKNTNHSWCDELIKLVSGANNDRNTLIDKKVSSFSKEYLDELSNSYDEIIELGINQNKNHNDNYFFDEELSLLKDLQKYKRNYLLWAYNFNLPSTNNNSERNIRPVKSKMKISGLFQNIDNAKDYANIRSYIETCKKNNINIIDACIKLMNGNPYTLKEILTIGKSENDD